MSDIQRLNAEDLIRLKEDLMEIHERIKSYEIAWYAYTYRYSLFIN